MKSANETNGGVLGAATAWLDALALRNFTPETKSLFRKAVLGWFLLHTLLLLPYHAELWSASAFVPPVPFVATYWKSYIYSLLAIPVLSENVLWFVGAQVFVLVLAFLGFAPRALTALAFVLTMSLNQKASVIMDGGNNLSEILLFFLIFVDARPTLEGNLVQRPTLGALSNVASNIAFWLIKIQIVAVYATAGLCKAIGELWQNGTALYYILQNADYSMPFVRQFVVSHPEPFVVGTYFAVVFQLAFPFLVWKRATKPWILLAGVLLHLNIAFLMGLFLFGTFMCVSYVAFFEESWSARIREAFRRGPSVAAAFDSGCGPCMRFARLVKRLDVFDKVRVDDALRPVSPVLAAVDPSRRLDVLWSEDVATGGLRSGFDALLGLALHVVALWPLVPVLAGLSWLGLGDALYARLAHSRWRNRCRNGRCALAAPRPTTRTTAE